MNDLGGDDIEPYANALFRQWKLGQKDKNNGVLFLIAPKQHRMRIEVGYGLEGTLTDATSKLIIANAAAPRFKKGDYDGGVTRAVEDIITALTTDAAEWKPKPKAARTVGRRFRGSARRLPVHPVLDLVSQPALAAHRRRLDRADQHRRRLVLGGGGWSSGGSSDSGFSGGGGSSGGGGASGDW